MSEAAALEPSAITQSVMALEPGETRVIESGCIAQIRRACESARQKLVGSSFLIRHDGNGIRVWRYT
jgi:hypothetical protein